MISSTHNPKIQWVHKLQSQARRRNQDQVFVVEGVRLVEEALHSEWEAQLVLYTDQLDERGKTLLDKFSQEGVQSEEVTSQVMRFASDTQTPQGILAVLEKKQLPLCENPDFVFIPDAVRDPGNLGTMLRTAFAAGCNAVFVPQGSVDVFSPKVVRSAMGAHFHLPLYSLSWPEINEKITRYGLRIFLADANRGTHYMEVNYRQPLAFVVGGEAEGAGSLAQELTDERVYIPMPGPAESLNAAVAAGIILFTIVQQRTSHS